MLAHSSSIPSAACCLRRQLAIGDGIVNRLLSSTREREAYGCGDSRSLAKFDNYQKSTQQIVNLAFSLIASATVLSIVYRVFPR